MRAISLSVVACFVVLLAHPRAAQASILPHSSLEYDTMHAEAIIGGIWRHDGKFEIEKSFYGPFRSGDIITVVIHDPIPAEETVRFQIDKKWKMSSVEEHTVTSRKFIAFIKKGLYNEKVSWIPQHQNSSLRRIENEKVYLYQQTDNPGPYKLLRDAEHEKLSDLEETIAKYLTEFSDYHKAIEWNQTGRIRSALRQILINVHERDVFWKSVLQLAEAGATAAPFFRERIISEKDPQRRKDFLRGLNGCRDTSRENEDFLLKLLNENRKLVKSIPSDWSTIPEKLRDAASERMTIVAALANIGGEKSIGEIRAEILNAIGGSRRLIEYAIEALDRNPSPENLPVLEKVYRSLLNDTKSKHIRCSIIRALDKHRYSGTIPILIQCLDDPDKDNVRLTCDTLRRATRVGERKWTADDWKKWWEEHKGEYETKDNEGD